MTRRAISGRPCDSAEFGTWALTSPGDSGLVVWRLSGEGTTLWAVRGGGAGVDNLHAVATVGRRLYPVAAGTTCASCDVVAGGSFTSRATFGGDAAEHMLIGAGLVIDAAGPARYCLPRHQTHFEPSFLELNSIDDVASNICPALLRGAVAAERGGHHAVGGQGRRVGPASYHPPRRPTPFEQSFIESNGIL